MAIKLCIIRDDRLGDLILSMPVIESLKKNNNIEISLIASSINYDFANKTKVFQNIHVSENGFINKINLIKKVRRENFDLIVNCSGLKGKIYKLFLPKNNTITSILLSRYKKNSHIKKKIIKFIQSLFFNKVIIVDRYNDQIQNNTKHQTNIVKDLFDNSNLIVDKINDYTFKTNKNAEKNLVIIHLSNSWLQNSRLEKLQKIISAIINDTKYNIKLTTEKKINERFNEVIKNCKKNKERIRILLEPSLNQLIKVMGDASFVITPECGCSHIATMLNTKTIIIYDNNNLPGTINQEYEPYQKIYFKLVFKEDDIIQKTIEILKLK